MSESLILCVILFLGMVIGLIAGVFTGLTLCGYFDDRPMSERKAFSGSIIFFFILFIFGFLFGYATRPVLDAIEDFMRQPKERNLSLSHKKDLLEEVMGELDFFRQSAELDRSILEEPSPLAQLEARQNYTDFMSSYERKHRGSCRNSTLNKRGHRKRVAFSCLKHITRGDPDL